MQYTEGYVAFIDILGFSNYVNNADNGNQTLDLFEFVEKFCYLFNTSPSLKINVSFFSDSIILSSCSLDKLVIPILMAESYLRDKLGLLFRGGIAYGQYYYHKDVTFGPAIVSAYQLEKCSCYSRIILDKSITLPEEESIFYYKDYDGYYCINPQAWLLNQFQAFGPDGVSYPETDILSEIEKHAVKARNQILSDIKRYTCNPVVEKYLWRIRPFNYTCRFYANLPVGTEIYSEINYSVDERFRELFSSLPIEEKDYQQQEGESP